ncbi:2-C-methyl-D-erythritol 2,4-cyclodiphosphate synthase [Candidatus Beckwithbacteria bacterium CG10_big_fil_rev_8_21_14_0_10_34_10]|uniref:2-C-methyl-D-erythritol 2,4-cyclodiphosphate synthase n=1 Tax=Candidatus Beckwithbacteria bacterium CG10_big_fil_rev_8_21_14_0_10_34_10 TaxID=1974495 RepID=A0A2H0W9C5_9BACT|nr:MAG: 2-C-methyl-D-erythritol 2,4-cyclodiphosphate synthase [Candidatus Beckwithbacteria bacterium CG10_big_fil_rev_8_21_14_0_10_34_10]
MFRIGIGLDSHRIRFKTSLDISKQGGKTLKARLKGEKNLILGGVEVRQDCYFLADSDGDVVLHSLSNALSTAIGGGSLDTWAGPMFKKGIKDSREFLKAILKKVKAKGFRISNVAIMVEGQKPKLEPHRVKMQLSLAKLLQLDKQDIGIAFTTGQDLTPFGKGQGIQAFSTILLNK